MPTSTVERPVQSNSPAKRRAQRALVRSLYRRLLAHFGPQNWWPAQSRWEMLVGAILTQNTSWKNVEKALAQLRRARALNVDVMARMPRARLEKLVHASGYYRQKAERLQELARTLRSEPHLRRVLLESSRSGDRASRQVSALRERLLAIRGVGPETADSMILYAAGLPSFVVDAYTRRIGRRMGLFDTDRYDEVQRFFTERVRKEAALYNEYHALLVMLAKHFCTKSRPNCPQCPARAHCAFARRLRHR